MPIEKLFIHDGYQGHLLRDATVGEGARMPMEYDDVRRRGLRWSPRDAIVGMEGWIPLGRRHVSGGG